MKSPRQSNMELLRIVSMLMILTVHVDGASLGLPEPGGDISVLDARAVWRLVVETMSIIGVNCFTMISGYFGIRLRWRSVLSYLFQCVFYSVGIYTAFMILFPANASWRGWMESWMVLTHTDLWYVPAYFMLMLLSPWLNAGSTGISRRAFARLLAALGFVTFWCGWWWDGAFNPTGYTVMQFVFVYLSARFIRLYPPVTPRPVMAGIYLLSLAGIFVSALYLPSLKAFAYNSPFVMLSTVAFFMLFRDTEMYSPLINRVARAAFAVYLIHKAPLVWGNVMKPLVMRLWDSLPLPLFTFAAIGVVIAFYLLGMTIDPLRRRISSFLLGK